MEKLWTGRFEKSLSGDADDFNTSLPFDKRMYRQDILGSIAHAEMLDRCGIISHEDNLAIAEGLAGILEDIENGVLAVEGAEDIHSFVEDVLTARIGDAGRRLHTARSRNDQVAVDLRLYLRDRCDDIKKGLKNLLSVICDKAEENADTVMPGYTHLQRAQPIAFGHQLMAYAFMLLRDLGRFEDCVKRMNISPLGACALAGTTYDTDRDVTASLLGFDAPCQNSIDGVSDRDFAVETAFACSMTMMHLSRFAEEVILWCSWEFGFVTLDDSYSTGSSIMPQKKNPDIAELVRGKTGRVYGDLVTLLTVLKGLPLAYNKDMQEDKEAVFDAVDTLEMCLSVFAPMLKTMTVRPEKMRKAALEGFINATDCADYLTKKGVPFRTAYKITGSIVGWCIKNNKTLESMTMEEYLQFSAEFDKDIYKATDMDECMKKRISHGGTCPDSVCRQIQQVRSEL